MQFYIKQKDLELWEIMFNNPIIIGKFKDEYIEDDYKKISKNFKVINILYCALTIDIYDSISHCDSAKELWGILYYIYGTDQNVVLSEFVAQDEIITDENVKQVKNCQHHEEQECENDNPIQDLLYDAIEQTRIMELFKNGEKDKDSCHSSILKNGKYEVRSMVEFSNNNILSTCHIFDDLITTRNFQHPKILDYDVKSKKLYQD